MYSLNSDSKRGLRFRNNDVPLRFFLHPVAHKDSVDIRERKVINKGTWNTTREVSIYNHPVRVSYCCFCTGSIVIELPLKSLIFEYAYSFLLATSIAVLVANSVSVTNKTGYKATHQRGTCRVNEYKIAWETLIKFSRVLDRFQTTSFQTPASSIHITLPPCLEMNANLFILT